MGGGQTDRQTDRDRQRGEWEMARRNIGCDFRILGGVKEKTSKERQGKKFIRREEGKRRRGQVK